MIDPTAAVATNTMISGMSTEKNRKLTVVESVLPNTNAVSYTHLTLPTSDLV